MTPYSRHQLLLVLLIAGAAGAGLAIDHWRRASPDLVERLERADRVERPAPDPGVREPRRAARSAREPADARGRSESATRERGVREPRHVSRQSSTRDRDTDDAPTPEVPLDVNRASVPELTRLPGIGPKLAERIVQARPFEALDDLVRVQGVRPRLLARLRPLLMITP
jgi:DNA uptake protein ComE-like DNA-binding protein